MSLRAREPIFGGTPIMASFATAGISGNFPHPEAFTACLVFEGDYETLYDQAGLMLRLDQERWIKCGIEHSDGMTNFSIVVTRGNSDWSVIGQPLISGPQTVRLTAENGAIIAHFRAPDGAWQLMRVADFPMSATAMIGPDGLLAGAGWV
jgi:regulation of enolase protein 1 (concanavalin A-like superfamily)